MKGKTALRKSGRYFVTGTSCAICDKLKENLSQTIEEQKGGPAKIDPLKYIVHNWYTYAQTYSPEFVKYIIQREGISNKDLIIDPFAGTGTTLVEANLNSVNSIGIEAIDFLAFVSRIKTEWDIDVDEFDSAYVACIKMAKKNYAHTKPKEIVQNAITTNEMGMYKEFLKRKYIFVKPLAKILTLKQVILESKYDKKVKELLLLALAGIVRASSNMKFGPEIGLRRKRVGDKRVVNLFEKKVIRISNDLRAIQKGNLLGKSKVGVGDSRQIKKELEELGAFFDYGKTHVITSPPYPQDHDYTRSVRLELVLLDFGKSKLDFREMKQRMVRSCTRGIYSTDEDNEHIQKFDDVVILAQKIDAKVRETGGTSGFEKLYPKLVLEYFGGMYRFLSEAYEMLSKNGTVNLLVGDSHAFKMTHIETARLLERLALDIGFRNSKIETWRYIRSTAHNLLIPENILTLYK